MRPELTWCVDLDASSTSASFSSLSLVGFETIPSQTCFFFRQRLFPRLLVARRFSILTSFSLVLSPRFGLLRTSSLFLWKDVSSVAEQRGKIEAPPFDENATNAFFLERTTSKVSDPGTLPLTNRRALHGCSQVYRSTDPDETKCRTRVGRRDASLRTIVDDLLDDCVDYLFVLVLEGTTKKHGRSEWSR